MELRILIQTYGMMHPYYDYFAEPQFTYIARAMDPNTFIKPTDLSNQRDRGIM